MQTEPVCVELTSVMFGVTISAGVLIAVLLIYWAVKDWAEDRIDRRVERGLRQFQEKQ